MGNDHPELKMMPLIIGPQRISNPLYANMESVTVQYETEEGVIAPLLPEVYRPANDSLVTVAYSQSQGVDFMAGNGYRLLSVAVSAQYDGEMDHFEGDFVLVMFEDAAMPIITGRELQGIPKIYADLSPVKTIGNKLLRCEVSLWGHFLMGINLELPLKRQNAIVRRAANKITSDRPVLGYKYIPSLDGLPDADYPTIFWSDYQIERLLFGKNGSVDFGNPREQDIGMFESVVDALKTLSIKKVVRTSRSMGSMIIRNDKCRRLK
jgi:acetoacetate decarboxylase